jgi:hypothetical protein
MSEENTETTPEATESEQEVVTPPEATGWWQFQSKDDAAEWANGVVEKRLARERKKMESILAEHGTLKAEVERLKPLEDATKTDAQRWEAEKESFTKELEELRSFRKSAERTNLVREIAEDKGLPAKFVKYVSGEDADSITESVDELLNVLSEDGKPSKKPASQKPRATDEQPATKGHGGGGSDPEDDSTTTARIMKKYRESRNSFSL